MESPGKRILVADDDRAVQQLVRTVLIRAGFDVETASNGREAMEKIGKEDYDVVVLDLMMPQMSGFDVLQQLNNRTRKARFVVVMSAASQTVVTSASGPNVYATLRKPFEIEEMVRTVRECADPPTQ